MIRNKIIYFRKIISEKVKNLKLPKWIIWFFSYIKNIIVIFTFISLSVSGYIFIKQNYCSVILKEKCESIALKKLGIGISDTYLSSVLWETVRKRNVTLNWYDNVNYKLSNDKEFQFELIENVYILNNFIVTTYSNFNTSLIECFYVIETSGKSRAISTKYDYLWNYRRANWKSKPIQLNSTRIWNLNSLPYIWFVAYYPAAYGWAWIVTQVYWGFELYYNYLIYWNIWWWLLWYSDSIEENLMTIHDRTKEEDISNLSSIEAIPNNARNAYKSVSDNAPLNMYWIWSKSCIDNKLLPARERDFWYLPKVIDKYR